MLAALDRNLGRVWRSKEEVYMMHSESARETMVDTQVRPNDVTDTRIHDALLETPRESFLPKVRHSLAYAECEHETVEGRFIWCARDFSKLLQAANVQPDDEVLDLAPGTGYSTAILSRLSAAVIGVEDDESVAEKASETLSNLDIDNADIVFGDLKTGLKSEGPYDLIFVNGVVEYLPDDWFAQLRDGGRIAVVVKDGALSQARIYSKNDDVVSWKSMFHCKPPILPGFVKEKSFTF
jgi:protein-L-isoaspartate(D-aspartate) O-methyltransferase